MQLHEPETEKNASSSDKAKQKMLENKSALKNIREKSGKKKKKTLCVANTLSEPAILM